MKKRITFLDVHEAIQHLFQKQIQFSQDFIYVRGANKHTAVEEKVNAFLSYLPVAHIQDPSDDVPRRVPVHALNNGYKVIQEGHHAAVAFALMDKKGIYPHGIPVDYNNFGQNKVRHIFIEEDGRWHITALDGKQWKLFDKEIDKPLRFGRTGLPFEEYRKSVSANTDLGRFLASCQVKETH
ncbi:MAG: hypothetical protein OEZ43_05590 [Gammaproteobacteria bacterium]|nr:hypothetical protein [Gammaproteobacteria bacterium]